MNCRVLITGLLSAFAFAGIASAQTTGSGTVAVSATVEGSILMTFSTDPSGLAMTGTGTSAGTLPLGTVSMYGGTVPANVTKTLQGILSFTLATPIDIRVDQSNTSGTTCTLTANLTTADAINTWTLGAIPITDTPVSLTATGPYATVVPYTLSLLVPATSAAGAVSNTINFTATAN